MKSRTILMGANKVNETTTNLVAGNSQISDRWPEIVKLLYRLKFGSSKGLC